MAQVIVDTVLHLRDFGLERLDEDSAIVGFAQKKRKPGWCAGPISPKGALLFLMVPGDNESGTSKSTTATSRPSPISPAVPIFKLA
jgi:hypothetical protein